MRRRLTLICPGATFASDMDHADAEHLLERWRAVMGGEDDGPSVVQVDGVPVMHVALASVVAITDEITGRQP